MADTLTKPDEPSTAISRSNGEERNPDGTTPHMRAHPDVLCIRWQIYAKANRCEAAADIALLSATILLAMQPNVDGSKQWLKQAIEMGDSNEVKQVALDDLDLEPLRNEIGEL